QQQFQAIAHYFDGVSDLMSEVTTEAKWSTNTTMVGIDETGLATANGVVTGSCEILAEYTEGDVTVNAKTNMIMPDPDQTSTSWQIVSVGAVGIGAGVTGGSLHF